VKASNPDALVAHAYVELHYGWNFDEAEAAFRRALELNPGGVTGGRKSDSSGG
jgi:hypothetical protein